MSNQIGQLTCMGQVETQPSIIPFQEFIKPTDFDYAFENMRVRIRDRYDWSTAWRLLGAFGSPLKKWLTAYIETSSKYQESYTPGKAHTWMTRLMEYEFNPTDLEKYFEVFYNLYNERQITGNIYAPYTYTPSKPDPFRWAKTYAFAGMLLAAGIGYMYVWRKSK